MAITHRAKRKGSVMKFRSRFRTASLISALLVLGLLGCLSELQDGNHAQREASDRERESLALSAELRNSSDELTRLARTYVVTGNSRYEKQYWSVLYQPAVRLTRVRDSQTDESLNQWRPAFGGRDHGISDRLAG